MSDWQIEVHDDTSEDGADEPNKVDEPELRPHLVLNLGGEHAIFAVKGQKANQFLLVRWVDGLSQPNFRATQAVTMLALGQVTAAESSRLSQYLERHGFDDDYEQALYTALETCWRGETMLPFAPSSDS